MTTRILKIPSSIAAELVDCARRELPNECCGLLAGRGDVVHHLFPLINEAASPFEFHAERSLFAPFQRMRSMCLELTAIYHSHPASPAIPSRLDRERNYYPDAIHLIISLTAPAPVVRAWLLTNSDVQEVAVQIE